MDYEDELPCGGYANEDATIEQEIKDISLGSECEKTQC